MNEIEVSDFEHASMTFEYTDAFYFQIKQNCKQTGTSNLFLSLQWNGYFVLVDKVSYSTSSFLVSWVVLGELLLSFDWKRSEGEERVTSSHQTLTNPNFGLCLILTN